jgi:hypothetical protein
VILISLILQSNQFTISHLWEKLTKCIAILFILKLFIRHSEICSLVRNLKWMTANPFMCCPASATIHESLGPSPAAKTLMMSAFYFSCFECSSIAHLLSGICRGKSRFGIAWCMICFMYIMLILWLHTFSIIIEYVSIYPHMRNLFGQLT